jgi:hypothetical protein
MRAKYLIYDESNDELVDEGDFREGIDEEYGLTTKRLPLGIYRTEIIYDSIYTKSDNNSVTYTTSTYPDLKLYVEPEEIIENFEVSYFPQFDENNVITHSGIAVSWTLLHKSGMNLKLHIQGEDDSTPITYNVDKYHYVKPSTVFDVKKKLNIWFTYDSDYVNWEIDSNGRFINKPKIKLNEKDTPADKVTILWTEIT